MQSKHSLKVRLEFPYKRVGNELRFWSSLKVKRQGASLTNRARDMAPSKHKNGSKTNSVSSLPLVCLCLSGDFCNRESRLSTITTLSQMWQHRYYMIHHLLTRKGPHYLWSAVPLYCYSKLNISYGSSFTLKALNWWNSGLTFILSRLVTGNATCPVSNAIVCQKSKIISHFLMQVNFKCQGVILFSLLK